MHGLSSRPPVVIKATEQISAIDVAKEISLEASPQLVRLSLLKLNIEQPDEWTYRALRYALCKHKDDLVVELAMTQLSTLARLRSEQDSIVATLGAALLSHETGAVNGKILEFARKYDLREALIPYIAASFSEISAIEFLSRAPLVLRQKSSNFEVLPVIFDGLQAHGARFSPRVEQQMGQSELLNWRSLDTSDASSSPRMTNFLAAMDTLLVQKQRLNEYQDRTLARIMLTAPQEEQRRDAAAYLFKGKTPAELYRLSPIIFYGLNRVGTSDMHGPDLRLARVVDDFLLAALRDLGTFAESALPLIEQSVKRSAFNLNVNTMAQELQLCCFSPDAERAFTNLCNRSAAPNLEENPYITYRSLVYISVNGLKDFAVQAKQRVESLLLVGSDLPRLREGLTMLISRDARIAAIYLDLLCELTRRGVDRPQNELAGALAIHAAQGIKRARDFYPAGSESKYLSFVAWFESARNYYFPA